MPDRYSEAEIERARLCVELLPEPGCEVALRLIATLDAIKAERDRAVEALRDMIDLLTDRDLVPVVRDENVIVRIERARTALAAAKKEEA